MSAENELQSPFGNFLLKRFPTQNNLPLRAWDAADEYILDYIHENKILNENSKVLILNDGFGALTINLRLNQPTNWSDSFLAHKGCENNFKVNEIAPTWTKLKSTDELTGEYDIIIIKIPKSTRHFKVQLQKINDIIGPKAKVISGGMIKHLPRSTQDMLTKIIGPTNTSLARKKARLFFSDWQEKNVSQSSPTSTYFNSNLNQDLLNFSNVFSRDKLDKGTAILLEQFDKLPNKRKVIDLGCGNGILGLRAQQLMPDSRVTFIDESYMAVASAKFNFENIFDSKKADFLTGNCLDPFDGNADLILCNPPFHQQHAIGDFIAWNMFVQSFDKLESRGELWIVGNRHMNYHAKLQKLFKNCELIVSNKTFVVLRAIKN
jgi:16S rRNA (guanine1207-N2)-methyltransferase